MLRGNSEAAPPPSPGVLEGLLKEKEEFKSELFVLSVAKHKSDKLWSWDWNFQL